MIEAEIWIFGHFVAGVHTHFASRDWKTFNGRSRPGFTAYDEESVEAIEHLLDPHGSLHRAMSG